MALPLGLSYLRGSLEVVKALPLSAVLSSLCIAALLRDARIRGYLTTAGLCARNQAVADMSLL